MATDSSILAWKIPGREESGRLHSMGSQRVGHDWATSLSLFQIYILRWPDCITVVFRHLYFTSSYWSDRLLFTINFALEFINHSHRQVYYGYWILCVLFSFLNYLISFTNITEHPLYQDKFKANILNSWGLRTHTHTVYSNRKL